MRRSLDRPVSASVLGSPRGCAENREHKNNSSGLWLIRKAARPGTVPMAMPAFSSTIAAGRIACVASIREARRCSQ